MLTNHAQFFCVRKPQWWVMCVDTLVSTGYSRYPNKETVSFLISSKKYDWLGYRGNFCWTS